LRRWRAFGVLLVSLALSGCWYSLPHQRFGDPVFAGKMVGKKVRVVREEAAQATSSPPHLHRLTVQVTEVDYPWLAGDEVRDELRVVDEWITLKTPAQQIRIDLEDPEVRRVEWRKVGEPVLIGAGAVVYAAYTTLTVVTLLAVLAVLKAIGGAAR